MATTGLGAMPHDLAVRLLDILGRDALAFDAVVNEVTGPKTDEEIANARKAVAIAERAHEHMLAYARAGMRECDLAVENQTILEEDMVFVVHPNQYLPETGYLLCGEPVRVTATGYESLSSKWAELGVVGA